MKLIKNIGIKEVNGKRRSTAIFECSYCGKQIEKRKDVGVHNESCGCRVGHNLQSQSEANITHNMSKSKQYTVWNAMRERCHNPKNPGYHNYGGRGITYSDKWATFKGFWEDMGDTYVPGLTIERVDVNKGYSKDNCIWIKPELQARNRRDVVLYKIDNIRYTIPELSKKSGVPESTLRHRLVKMKLTPKQAIDYV